MVLSFSQGKFGSTCSTPLATMSDGMITYTLDVNSGNTTMQLFVQSSTGKKQRHVAAYRWLGRVSA